MGVGDYAALLSLTEDLLQLRNGDYPAVDYIAQQISRTNRGQLVAVAHHYEPASETHCTEQLLEQYHVHH